MISNSLEQNYIDFDMNVREFVLLSICSFSKLAKFVFYSGNIELITINRIQDVKLSKDDKINSYLFKSKNPIGKIQKCQV